MRTRLTGPQQRIVWLDCVRVCGCVCVFVCVTAFIRGGRRFRQRSRQFPGEDSRPSVLSRSFETYRATRKSCTTGACVEIQQCLLSLPRVELASQLPRECDCSSRFLRRATRRPPKKTDQNRKKTTTTTKTTKSPEKVALEVTTTRTGTSDRMKTRKNLTVTVEGLQQELKQR